MDYTNNIMSLKGKKVLLFAPSFYSLHEEIIASIKSHGASVGFIPDKVQDFSPRFKSTFMRWLKVMYFKFINPNKRYLKKYNNLLDQYWDFFLCIDGFSFDYGSFKIIKEHNPDIKTILYLWDDLSFYDFSDSFNFFSSIYTFDHCDAVKYKLKFLPLYWVNNRPDRLENNIIKYDISFIGTLHSDRYKLLNIIIEQCKQLNLKYYIKLVVNKRKNTFLDKIRLLYHKLKNSDYSSFFIEEYNIVNNAIENPILTSDKIESNKINRIIAESRCIIDITKPGQNGLSNRTIAALAAHKKVISTNKNLSNDLEIIRNICLLKRDKPLITPDFIKSPFITNDQISNEINSLEINNWINTLLYDGK